MEVGGPEQWAVAGVVVADAAHGRVEPAGGISAGGQAGIHVGGDPGSDIIDDRPQGTGHMRVAGELERGRDVDDRIGQYVATARGAAGRQVREVRVWGAQSSDVRHGQITAGQDEPACRRVCDIGNGMAGDVDPGRMDEPAPDGIRISVGMYELTTRSSTVRSSPPVW